MHALHLVGVLELIFHSFIEVVCPKTRSEIYRCGTPSPIPAIHHDWGKHRQNRTARRRPFSTDLHTMYRGPGPHALFWGPPYSTYTNAGHCLHVLLQGDGSRPVAPPLPASPYVVAGSSVQVCHFTTTVHHIFTQLFIPTGYLSTARPQLYFTLDNLHPCSFIKL